MAEELFDLDAAKAAQRDAAGESFTFTYTGEKYQIPPSTEWPVEASTYIATGDFHAALQCLLELDDPEAPARFFNAAPTLGHFKLVFDEIARREGMTDASNSPPSLRPGSPPT